MNQNTKIGVVGLGYVGLPLARLFSTHFHTVGFDIDTDYVDKINSNSVSPDILDPSLLRAALEDNLLVTSNPDELKDCDVYIIAVPTPVDVYNYPDLSFLKEASRLVGLLIAKDNIVIYESTVYPGVTEEVCIPILEHESGLIVNQDFFVGYSPERINPGDKEHSIEKIKKVTSGSTPKTAEYIDNLYNTVLENGTYLASSIRVAEASKIIENAQRDVNIAFMNELARIFNAMDIDTHDVLAAASSKWNFMQFEPGLVGGHCIGVDPYYLIQKAQVYGYYPNIMMEARRLNNSMGDYVARQVIKLMNKKGLLLKDAKILILGATFKENCSDIRNTKVLDIYYTLREYTDRITIYDPLVDIDYFKSQTGVDLFDGDISEIKEPNDALILAVPHKEFQTLNIESLVSKRGVIYDVKGVLPREIVSGRL